MKLSIDTVFLASLGIYSTLLLFVVFFYSKSGDPRTAHENLPKTIKNITEGFLGTFIFLLLFYLATTGNLPTNVLITLVSVFATAGFLNLRNKN